MTRRWGGLEGEAAEATFPCPNRFREAAPAALSSSAVAPEVLGLEAQKQVQPQVQACRDALPVLPDAPPELPEIRIHAPVDAPLEAHPAAEATPRAERQQLTLPRGGLDSEAIEQTKCVAAPTLPEPLELAETPETCQRPPSLKAVRFAPAHVQVAPNMKRLARQAPSDVGSPDSPPSDLDFEVSALVDDADKDVSSRVGAPEHDDVQGEMETAMGEVVALAGLTESSLRVILETANGNPLPLPPTAWSGPFEFMAAMRPADPAGLPRVDGSPWAEV